MPEQTNIVKGSNLGFLLGILLVVGLGMYLYKSGFMSDRFGLSSTTPSPTPTAAPVVQIDDEPITLLDEEFPAEYGKNEEESESKTEGEEQEVLTHTPADTALGDNPMILLSLLVVGAGASLIVSKKLA